MCKIKSVVYSRTSTNLLEQNTSYEQQLMYNDIRFNIVDRLGERASAFKNFGKRKVLQEILYNMGIDIKAVNHQFIFIPTKRECRYKCIICANTSRLSRNLLECKMMLRAIHQKKCKVFFIDMNKFSDEPNFELVLTILQSLDEEYSKQTGFKIKQGIKRLKENNQLIIASNKWFGWDYIKNENKLIINEIEANIIKKIFKLYSKGLGCRKIAEKINKEYGENFDKTNILRWIKRKEYIGQHPNSYGIYEKNHKIESIVSEELFYKCQNILENKNKNDGGKKYNLSGKIYCKCGGKFIRRTGRKGTFNYKCNNKVNNKGCNNGFLSFEYINEYIYRCIKEDRHRLTTDFNQIINRYKNIDIQIYDNDLKEIDRILKKLIEFMIEGTISKRAYKVKEQEVFKRKDEILFKINKAKNINNKLDKISQIQKKFLKKLEEYESIYKRGNMEELHGIISSIACYKFVVDDNEDKPIIEAKLTNLKWREFRILYDFLENEMKVYQLNIIE